MDVTSLLNSSSAAAAAALQRRDSVGSSTPSATGDTTATSTAVPTPSPERTPPRRASGSRSPGRNRTPWDAGGYSLPLTLDTKSIPSFTSTGNRPSFYHNSESPTDCGRNSSVSPKSPKHKFSDSRSSLSSYTSSSTTSHSHSRISSLSTVSEYQPLTALITDISLDGKMPPSKIGEAVNRGRSDSRAGSTSTPSFGSTPVGQPRDDFEGSSAANTSPILPNSSERPRSPSDAVMIRRGGADSLTGTGSPPNTKSEVKTLLSAESSPATLAHRRAVSAPDRAHSVATMASLPAFQLNFTASSVQHPTTSQALLSAQVASHPVPTGGHVSAQAASQPVSDESGFSVQLTLQQAVALVLELFPDIGNQVFVDPASGQPTTFSDLLVTRLTALEHMRDELIIQINEKREPCMYTTPCLLNSSPRKAISHLFGRNKLCTRQIPSHVWVHYCRKHYQRSRYRNQDDFSKLQATMVEITIFRVQVWSDMNQQDAAIKEARGEKVSEPVRILKGWTLAKRKREQQRLDNKKNGSNKRCRPHDEDEDSDDGETEPNFDKGLAVEGWLLEKCGKTYTTHQMLAIAHRVWYELETGQRKKMPDMEILPIIDVIDKNVEKPKCGTRRKPHKRSQSMNVAMQPQSQDSLPMARRVSHPNVPSYWTADESGSPAEKRQRVNEMSNAYQGRQDNLHQLPRRTERIVPVSDSNNSFRTHHSRISFSSIHESSDEDRFGNHSQQTPTTLGNYSSYGVQLAGSHGPLPVPTPQGVARPPMTQQHGDFEQGSRFETRGRPSHQRSISDAGAFQHYGSSLYPAPGPLSYTQAAFQPSGYPQTSNGYAPASSSSMAPYMNYPRSSRNDQASSSATTGLHNYQGSYSSAAPHHPETAFAMPSYVDPNHGYGYDIGGATNRSSGNAYSGGATNGSLGNVYGGGVKHTRHQSTPVAAQLPSLYNSDQSGLGAYSYQTRPQPSYSSSNINMPPVSEADVAKNDNYGRRA